MAQLNCLLELDAAEGVRALGPWVHPASRGGREGLVSSASFWARLRSVRQAGSESERWRAMRSWRRFEASAHTSIDVLVAPQRTERSVASVQMSRPTFYFDLGSPFAYLAAERLHDVFGEHLKWQPVSLGALFKLTGRSSWSLGDPKRRQAGMAEVERRACLYGLPPVSWPDPWPGNYLMAMRAATFAYSEGRGHEFVMQAFRNGFQEGCDLSIPAEVLRAAAESGLDAQAVERATQDAEIKLALREATDAAHQLGVFGVPTIAVGSELFWGDDRLEDAAAYVSASRPDSQRIGPSAIEAEGKAS